MSEENVALIRSTYRQRDPSRFFDLLDEEVEVDATAVGLLPDRPVVNHGKDAVFAYFAITGAPGTTTSSWSRSRSSTRVEAEFSPSCMSALRPDLTLGAPSLCGWPGWAAGRLSTPEPDSGSPSRSSSASPFRPCSVRWGTFRGG